MNYTDVFHKFVKDKPQFEEAFQIVRQNSSGNIWLMGGFLYRGITHVIYGNNAPEVDFDFLVESRNEDIAVPEGWEISKNRFENPKLVRGKSSIDFVPLSTVYSITYRSLPARIENFLTGVPLNIQTMVYDFRQGVVIGEVGLKAIEDKTVAVNNRFFAEYAAKKKELTLNEMIRRKAESLGFKPTFY